MGYNFASASFVIKNGNTIIGGLNGIEKTLTYTINADNSTITISGYIVSPYSLAIPSIVVKSGSTILASFNEAPINISGHYTIPPGFSMPIQASVNTSSISIEIQADLIGSIPSDDIHSPYFEYIFSEGRTSSTSSSLYRVLEEPFDPPYKTDSKDTNGNNIILNRSVAGIVYFWGSTGLNKNSTNRTIKSIVFFDTNKNQDYTAEIPYVKFASTGECKELLLGDEIRFLDQTHAGNKIISKYLISDKAITDYNNTSNWTTKPGAATTGAWWRNLYNPTNRTDSAYKLGTLTNGVYGINDKENNVVYVLTPERKFLNIYVDMYCSDVSLQNLYIPRQGSPLILLAQYIKKPNFSTSILGYLTYTLFVNYNDADVSDFVHDNNIYFTFNGIREFDSGRNLFHIKGIYSISFDDLASNISNKYGPKNYNLLDNITYTTKYITDGEIITDYTNKPACINSSSKINGDLSIFKFTGNNGLYTAKYYSINKNHTPAETLDTYIQTTGSESRYPNEINADKISVRTGTSPNYVYKLVESFYHADYFIRNIKLSAIPGLNYDINKTSYDQVTTAIKNLTKSVAKTIGGSDYWEADSSHTVTINGDYETIPLDSTNNCSNIKEYYVNHSSSSNPLSYRTFAKIGLIPKVFKLYVVTKNKSDIKNINVIVDGVTKNTEFSVGSLSNVTDWDTNYLPSEYKNGTYDYIVNDVTYDHNYKIDITPSDGLLLKGWKRTFEYNYDANTYDRINKTDTITNISNSMQYSVIYEPIFAKSPKLHFVIESEDNYTGYTYKQININGAEIAQNTNDVYYNLPSSANVKISCISGDFTTIDKISCHKKNLKISSNKKYYFDLSYLITGTDKLKFEDLEAAADDNGIIEICAHVRKTKLYIPTPIDIGYKYNQTVNLNNTNVDIDELGCYLTGILTLPEGVSSQSITNEFTKRKVNDYYMEIDKYDVNGDKTDNKKKYKTIKYNETNKFPSNFLTYNMEDVREVRLWLTTEYQNSSNLFDKIWHLNNASNSSRISGSRRFTNKSNGYQYIYISRPTVGAGYSTLYQESFQLYDDQRNKIALSLTGDHFDTCLTFAYFSEVKLTVETKTTDDNYVHSHCWIPNWYGVNNDAILIDNDSTSKPDKGTLTIPVNSENIRTLPINYMHHKFSTPYTRDYIWKKAVIKYSGNSYIIDFNETLYGEKSWLITNKEINDKLDDNIESRPTYNGWASKFVNSNQFNADEEAYGFFKLNEVLPSGINDDIDITIYADPYWIYRFKAIHEDTDEQLDLSVMKYDDTNDTLGIKQNTDTIFDFTPSWNTSFIVYDNYIKEAKAENPISQRYVFDHWEYPVVSTTYFYRVRLRLNNWYSGQIGDVYIGIPDNILSELKPGDSLANSKVNIYDITDINRLVGTGELIDKNSYHVFWGVYNNSTRKWTATTDKQISYGTNPSVYTNYTKVTPSSKDTLVPGSTLTSVIDNLSLVWWNNKLCTAVYRDNAVGFTCENRADGTFEYWVEDENGNRSIKALGISELITLDGILNTKETYISDYKFMVKDNYTLVCKFTPNTYSQFTKFIVNGSDVPASKCERDGESYIYKRVLNSAITIIASSEKLGTWATYIECEKTFGKLSLISVEPNYTGEPSDEYSITEIYDGTDIYKLAFKDYTNNSINVTVKALPKTSEKIEANGESHFYRFKEWITADGEVFSKKSTITYTLSVDDNISNPANYILKAIYEPYDSITPAAGNLALYKGDIPVIALYKGDLEVIAIYKGDIPISK